MTSSNRTDFLSSAFRFNNTLKEESLLETLVERYQSVRQQHAMALENLVQMENNLGLLRNQVYAMMVESQMDPPATTQASPKGIYVFIYIYIYMYQHYYGCSYVLSY